MGKGHCMFWTWRPIFKFTGSKFLHVNTYCSFVCPLAPFNVSGWWTVGVEISDMTAYSLVDGFSTCCSFIHLLHSMCMHLLGWVGSAWMDNMVMHLVRVVFIQRTTQMKLTWTRWEAADSACLHIFNCKWNLPALWHRLSNTLSNIYVVKNHITPHCKWLFSLSRNFNLSFGWACLWYYHVLYNFLTGMFMSTLLCQNMHKQSRSIPWPPCHAEVLLHAAVQLLFFLCAHHIQY